MWFATCESGRQVALASPGQTSVNLGAGRIIPSMLMGRARERDSAMPRNTFFV